MEKLRSVSPSSSKGQRYVPRATVTDKLASYAAAKKELMSSVAHQHERGPNSRAESSPDPTRARERAMRRLKSTRRAQRFLSVHVQVSNHFRPSHHSTRACHYRILMTGRFAFGSEITGMSDATAICV
jgi:putative transposase